MIFQIVNKITASLQNETIKMNEIEVFEYKTFELTPDFHKNIKFSVDLSLPREMQFKKMHKVAKYLSVTFYDNSNFKDIVLQNIVELHDNMNNINDVHVLKCIIHKIGMQTNLCNEILNLSKKEIVSNFVAYDSIAKAFSRTLRNANIDSNKTIVEQTTETNAFDENTKNLLKYLSTLQKHIALDSYEVTYFISLIKPFEGHQILFDEECAMFKMLK